MSLRKKTSGNNQKEHTIMKRFIKTTGWLAMAAALTLGTAACSSDDNISSEQPANPTGKYIMTVQASKGDATATRGLELSADGKTLHATWTDGEKVDVYEGITRLGTLVATNSNGATCTLSGTLDKAPSASGITLTLEFNGIVQSHQYGTLDYIATHCDHAIATTVVTVNGATITGTDAIFENQQAIVKFKITDKGGNALNASKLVLDIDLNDAMKTELSSHLTETQLSGLQDTYQINPSNATYETNGGTGILFLAISYPPKDLTSINNYLANQNISITIGPDDFKLVLTVTVGDDTYTLTKSGFPFTNGKYYEIATKMSPLYPIALSAATSIYTGSVVTSDGYVYATKDDATNAGKTAVAKIAYVGAAGSADASSDTYKGLALALNNACSGGAAWCSQHEEACMTTQYANTNDAKGDMAGIANTDALVAHLGHNHPAAVAAKGYKYAESADAGAHPVGTSGWFLPSVGQWDKMATAVGGYDILRSTYLSNMTYQIWSSTQCNAATAWRYVFNNSPMWNTDAKTDNGDNLSVRACFAF